MAAPIGQPFFVYRIKEKGRDEKVIRERLLENTSERLRLRNLTEHNDER